MPTTRTLAIEVNGKIHQVVTADDVPLLWVLRDVLGLKGTKYGCGQGLCGACTVHVGGKPTRSCITPVGSVRDKVLTIEGLAQAGHATIKAWEQLDVPQCGYCQPGQIMSAAGLLAIDPAPDDEAIDRAMSGNICRCGTYNAIREAIHRAADLQKQGNEL